MADETARNTIMKTVEEAAKMPAMVAKVVQLASTPTTSPKELAGVIRLDPVLSFQVLRLVNSALYGVRNEISSINQAVVMLGINTIKNLALSMGLAAKLKSNDKGSTNFNPEMFWRHSVAVAICSLQIARKANFKRAQQEEFFLAGLLHDMGKIIIFNTDAKAYDDALEESRERMARLESVEREHLGTDHKEVGEVLARKWSLSSAVLSGIIDCENVENAGISEELKLMGQVVQLADHYAQQLGFGIEGQYHEAPPDEFWTSIGVAREDLDQFVAETLPGEFERASGFLNSILSPQADMGTN